MCFTAQIDQIQDLLSSSKICRGAAACLAKMIDHKSETDQHPSSKAIQAVEPSDPGYRGLQEQS
jgi:hypothetical protein